jgi:hypothetical protein
MKSVGLQLEQDIDWRAAELAALRMQAAALPEGSIAYHAGLRALWAMLYAHYEGFCKFALDLYLDELGRAGILRSSLRDELLALSLEELFRMLRRDTSRGSLLKFFLSMMPPSLADRASFPVKLETNSNLWPDLLAENCAAAGLGIQAVNNHSAKLKALVSRRNDIAHGKKNIVRKLSDYAPYEAAVFDVVYELSLTITDAIEKKSYLKGGSLPA